MARGHVFDRLNRKATDSKGIRGDGALLVASHPMELVAARPMRRDARMGYLCAPRRQQGYCSASERLCGLSRRSSADHAGVEAEARQGEVFAIGRRDADTVRRLDIRNLALTKACRLYRVALLQAPLLLQVDEANVTRLNWAHWCLVFHLSLQKRRRAPPFRQRVPVWVD